MTKTPLMHALSIAVTLLLVACSNGGGGGTGGGSAGTGGGSGNAGGGTAATGGGTAATGGGTAASGGGTASTGGGTASTGGGTAGTGGGSGNADTICTNETTALCNKLNTCFPAFIQLGYGDVPTCIARGKISCVATFNLNGTGINATTIDACATAETSATCDQIAAGAQPAQCDIRGTLTNGTACGDNAQCSSGYCKISLGFCGVCAARVGAGSACGTSADCTTGLVCGGQTCKSAGSAGDPCDTSNPCGGGLYCSAATAGSCVALVTTAGGACPTGSGCSFFDGLTCNSSSVCATIPFAQAGSPCGVLTAGSYTFCQGGSYCKIPTGMTMGTCAVDVADGSACDTSTTTCLPNANCVNSVCALPDPGSCM